MRGHESKQVPAGEDLKADSFESDIKGAMEQAEDKFEGTASLDTDAALAAVRPSVRNNSMCCGHAALLLGV